MENEYLQSINMFSTVLRLMLALVCGGLLGLERGKKKRPAGFRTHMLVCVGSALAMITNQYMAEHYVGIDASRMASQVISGIGFLGAGTIMVTGLQKIRGLTTAAGLWVVACIGLAFGTGFYSGGIVATVLCYVINTVLHRFEARMETNARIIGIYVELADVSYIGKLLEKLRQSEINVTELETGKARMSDNHVGVLLVIRLAHFVNHSEIIEQLEMVEGVSFVEEVN
jgi:putative Mg2+ transporter-C (MgtC) family protein